MDQQNGDAEAPPRELPWEDYARSLGVRGRRDRLNPIDRTRSYAP